MQWRKGNHTEQKMHSEVLPGVLQSPVLQHLLLRSCSSPQNNTENRFIFVQICAARSLWSVSNNCLYSCLFLMFIFHFQPPTDVSLAAPDSFNALIHPCMLPGQFFHSLFPYTLLQQTQKSLTKPEAHWALTTRGSIAVQNPGKHQVLNVSQQHQHLPPHLPCQGCYFQIF